MSKYINQDDMDSQRLCEGATPSLAFCPSAGPVVAAVACPYGVSAFVRSYVTSLFRPR